MQRVSLNISAPHDTYEEEADAVANQVMRMPEQGVQRRCSCGGVASAGGECATCKAKRLQRMSEVSSGGGQQAPASVKKTINQSGSPLDSATRGYMENRFGRDFTNVRVHTDGEAAQSASDVAAKAYTVGENIVFGQGQYQPQSYEGKHLIAHELAHTLQQSTSPNSQVQRKLIVERPRLFLARHEEKIGKMFVTLSEHYPLISM